MKYLLILVFSLSLFGCVDGNLEDVSTDECASGSKWTGGDSGSELMHPGGNCVDCHRDEGEGPIYSFAGTVYGAANLREANDCAGEEGATVKLTGSDGNTITMTTNEAGNFFTTRKLSEPVTAEVTFEGTTSQMVTAVGDNDCNSCHTPNGREGAAGRIVWSLTDPTEN